MKKTIFIVMLIFSCSLFATGTKFLNITGKDQYNVEHSLENYKGKPVVLVFWASWCPTCRKELYTLDELYKKYGENKKDIIFLGINSEKRSDSIKFLSSQNHILPTIINENAFKKYRIKVFPTFFILDENGNVLNYVVGAIPKPILEKYINVNFLRKYL